MVRRSHSEKRDFPLPHGSLTYAEIFQQPELWPVTFALARAAAPDFEATERPVVVTGAGTSAYAAAAIIGPWPNAQAVPTTDLLIDSVGEIERRSPGFVASGLLISIARSGDSPESVAVVNRIKRLCPRVDHLAITCNAEGQLAKTPGVRAMILDPRTNDRSLAMTSSFSNLVLAGLCLRNSEQIGSSLPQICSDVQLRLPELDAWAEQLAVQPLQRVVILANRNLQSLASEASLKILEMTAGRTVTLVETFLGLRHGPMSFVTPDTLVLSFLSSSLEKRRYEEDLLNELASKRLGRIVAIAPEGVDLRSAAEVIPANAGHLPDEYRVPFEIPFGQLFAYHLSLKAGLNPDSPSPMGAITRVVQQFEIYDETTHV